MASFAGVSSYHIDSSMMCIHATGDSSYCRISTPLTRGSVAPPGRPQRQPHQSKRDPIQRTLSQRTPGIAGRVHAVARMHDGMQQTLAQVSGKRCVFDHHIGLAGQ